MFWRQKHLQTLAGTGKYGSVLSQYGPNQALWLRDDFRML